MRALLVLALLSSLWRCPWAFATPTQVAFTEQHTVRLSNAADLADTKPLFSSTPAIVEAHTPTLRARPTTVSRPRSPAALLHARLRSLYHGESVPVEWEPVEVMGPDVQDRHTLAQLARMTADAYEVPGSKGWLDVDPVWNSSFPFGWEDAANGFRGHVFVAADARTVVLSIKGTTLTGPTSKKDKFNDNLLFSCCCAFVDVSWALSTVCGCHRLGWRCDNACLEEALVQDSLFYNVGVELVYDLTARYPDADIWLTGHSLGGALASLLGTTFGLPAVAFEAPGEARAAARLHLPLPALAPVTHVYHTADPIPQGACAGAGSLCAQAGYALETRCHLGRAVVFDTVRKLRWHVDVGSHRIREVVKVLEREVEGGWDVDEEGRPLDVPRAREEVDCVDCYKWKFGDFGKCAGPSCIVP